MTSDNPPPFSESETAAHAAGEPPSYDAAPSTGGATLSVTCAEKGGDVLITLTPPREPLVDKKASRAPADIVCVIDVSGSMDSAATMPDESGQQTATELSILDVVRHAMRTIMATLGPQDRMAVVAFTDKASVYADLTYMDDEGKAEMDKTIVRLTPLGSTNLWDGLKAGMDLLNGFSREPAPEVVLPSVSSFKVGKPTPTPGGTVSRLKGFFDRKGKGKAVPTPTPPPPKEPEPEKVEPPKPEPVASTQVVEKRVSSIFLLTDGMPNVHPPSGELKAFEKYLDSHPPSYTVSTFGFGYSLDSQLLLQLATAGGGQYSFIPDSGMVGTIFVHAVANALATFAPTSTLAIESQAEIVVLGDAKAISTSWGVQVDFGDLMYGQTRDLVVRSQDPGNLNLSVTARFTPWTDNEGAEVRASALPASDAAARADIKYHVHRLTLASELLKASKTQPDQAQVKKLEDLEDSIRGDPDLASHKNALALAEDIEGQVLLAVENPTYWTRWGRHYLPSLARAHQRQHCVNFKDAGQLVYGVDSPVFVAARDALDKAFDDIPAPKPTRRTYGGYAGVQVQSMSAMNSSYGPCVDGASIVHLVDGTPCRVDALCRGDIVQTAAGPRGVVALVRTSMRGGVARMCMLPGGLRVTPWHPVRLPGTREWVFPADVTPARDVLCDAVYSILLERADGHMDAHAVCIDGVDVIALGHGVRDGILNHAFFADYEAVVHSIALLPEIYESSGVVACSGVVRGADGRVCGFVPSTSTSTTDALPRISESVLNARVQLVV